MTMCRRWTGPLVAVVLAAGAVAGTGTAQAAGSVSGAPGWHEGPYAAHEGQTVVVDFSKDPKHPTPTEKDNWPGKAGILVRCNVVATGLTMHSGIRSRPWESRIPRR